MADVAALIAEANRDPVECFCIHPDKCLVHRMADALASQQQEIERKDAFIRKVRATSLDEIRGAVFGVMIGNPFREEQRLAVADACRRLEDGCLAALAPPEEPGGLTDDDVREYYQAHVAPGAQGKVSGDPF